MPDNRVGRFANKRRRIFPRFLIEAFRELRLVDWPDRRTTVRLTTAVFMFALIFGLVISIVDFGLDKVFRKLFL